MKVKVFVLSVVLMGLSVFTYANGPVIMDMTDGRYYEGVSIEAISPSKLPINLWNHNTFNFYGQIDAKIDSSTIQLYEMNGSTPLLNILSHVSYGNGASITYTFKDGFTPIPNRMYRFEFKNKNTGALMTYQVKATDKMLIEVTGDLSSGTKHLISIGLSNERNSDTITKKLSKMSLVDSNGQTVATGKYELLEGNMMIVLNALAPLKSSEPYYLKCFDETVEINYSHFLKRNYLLVSSKPVIVMEQDDTFDYYKQFTQFYKVIMKGTNINPKYMDYIELERVNFNGNKIKYNDVLVNELVKVDYDPNYGGHEMLTLTIDKSYMTPGSYHLYIHQGSKKYDTSIHYFFDDADHYSVYQEGYQPIRYEHIFSRQNNSISLPGTGMGVAIKDFKNQSSLVLDVSKQSDKRLAYDFASKVIPPVASRTDLMIKTPVGEFINIQHRDYRDPEIIEISFDAQSDLAKKPGTFVIMQYDYFKQEWLELPTTFDVASMKYKAQTETLGQFAVMNVQKTFYDIQKHWAKDTLIDFATKDLIAGYKGMFRPNDTITHAEFVTLLVKLMKLELRDATLPYQDLSSKHWSYFYVTTAYDQKIAKDALAFNPNEEITRLEMAQLIANAYRANHKEPLITEALGFEDCKHLNEDQLNDIKLVQYLGIINGKSTTRFEPSQHATRAEAVVIISRFIK